MKKVFTTLSVCAIMVAMTLSAMAQTPAFVWKSAYDKDIFDNAVVTTKWEFANRSNASAARDEVKISSNGYVPECKGIYFRWDDKNKNKTVGGILFVMPWVFDMVEDGEFDVEVKNSSDYYGSYQISTETAVPYPNADAPEFYYVAFAKEAQNSKGKTEGVKNINMIFLKASWKVLDATVNIYKEWIEADDNADNDTVAFTKGFVLGENLVGFESMAEGKVTFSETETGLVGYQFKEAWLLCGACEGLCDGSCPDCEKFATNNITFPVYGGQTYDVVVVNKPIYYTVNYWNTNEFYCFSYEYEIIRGLWHTEQVRHGYDAVGRMLNGRPYNPSLTGYLFNGWVDADDLFDVTSDRDVYATWVFNGGDNGDGVWKITNANSWQVEKWGAMPNYPNQKSNGKDIGILECWFGSFSGDGAGRVIFASKWDFFDRYESVTITFFHNNQGAEVTFWLGDDGQIDYSIREMFTDESPEHQNLPGEPELPVVIDLTFDFMTDATRAVITGAFSI